MARAASSRSSILTLGITIEPGSMPSLRPGGISAFMPAFRDTLSGWPGLSLERADDNERVVCPVTGECKPGWSTALRPGPRRRSRTGGDHAATDHTWPEPVTICRRGPWPPTARGLGRQPQRHRSDCARAGPGKAPVPSTLVRVERAVEPFGHQAAFGV